MQVALTVYRVIILKEGHINQKTQIVGNKKRKILFDN